MKYKIIHIHTDQKFIDGSKIFEGDNFVNEIIVFGKESNYDGIYKDSVKIYRYSKNDINKVIKFCNTADIVVMWDLNFVKCYIANRISINVSVIWRFFGLELYSKIPEYVFSSLTLKVKENENIRKPFMESIKRMTSKIKQFIIYQSSFENEFEKAIKRINFFQGLSDVEYSFLKKKWPELPRFLQNPYSQIIKCNKSIQSKTNKIVIGNNRSAYNNHLDILNIINQSNNKTNFDFILLFNYGQNNKYAEIVRKTADDISNIKIIEDFLPFNEYREFYSKVCALVLNGHRQMAMANIFEALRYNVKVYLSEKNVILDWLRKEGFLVFTIDDFVADLETNNINLTESERQHNIKQLYVFRNKYSIEEFQKTLLKIVAKTDY